MENSNKKRVILIYLGHKGGHPPFAFKLAETLSRYAQLRVILSENIANVDEWKASSLDVCFFSVPKTLKELFNLKKVNVLLREIVKIIKEYKPDFILFTMIHPLNFLIKSRLRRKNIPIVSIIHDAVPHKGEKIWVKVIQKLEEKSSSHLIALTNFSASVLKEKYRDRNKKIITLTHPIMNVSAKVEFNNELRDYIKSISGNRFVFLFMGRIEKYKGLVYLLKAFSELLKNKSENVFLIVAGDGNLDSESVNLINEIGTTGKVLLINKFLSNSEVVTLFSVSDALVLPYIDASQSGVMSLAYNFQLPYITTSIQGLIEQSSYGLGGLIVPPGDFHSLASAMLMLAKNKTIYDLLKNEIVLAKQLPWNSWEYFVESLLKTVP